jgi:hypothetical protein
VELPRVGEGLRPAGPRRVHAAPSVRLLLPWPVVVSAEDDRTPVWKTPPRNSWPPSCRGARRRLPAPGGQVLRPSAAVDQGES